MGESLNTKTAGRVDWMQLLYPGRREPFSADEMARAGSDGPSATLVASAFINAALVGFLVLQLAPAEQTARLTAALVALGFGGSRLARYLWWRPWRRPLMWASLVMVAVMLVAAAGIRLRLPVREDRYWITAVLTCGCSLIAVLMWFLVIWRAQQIESRLREQAEREKAIEMARRLAAAQIEPHFLFNTLASLQHWVQTKDDRAAPLLNALTGYLRATLPLFHHPLLPADDELQAIERYLEVMQARLGARLRWRIEVEPALRRLAIPPGLLLTLVENAVGHGVEPQLEGGEVRLRGTPAGAVARFEVIDDGPGLAPGHTDGVGLANVRQRLALLGGGASLTLEPGDAGRGCRAVLQLPANTGVN